ncbi:ABC transporter substrate-binding protein [Oxalobacter vibrioformis]|uniref:ABC transporter substrate-binding protein n=1 Tax=Oxalobacter vibrioformis TaxID=933080 RepID=A0A9E9P2P7_9BURK|nr:ABC transporter substrate-binding protein [Oxalobacter vibrioformis]WAW10124.1 ABC transporter substrate-binding protein [Oxalobacter vibrioformis]
MKRVILAVMLCFMSITAHAEEKLPRVYGATFPSSFALYVFNPDLLAGWNGILRDYEKKYIPEKYQKLPVLGGWYGKGMIPDREILLKSHLDMAFLLSGDRARGDAIITSLRQLNIPLVVMPNVTLEDNISMFRNLGKTFNMPDRGNALGGYGEDALKKVGGMLKNLPEKKRVRVYMAQDVDGLTTTCDGSTRSKAIRLAGGSNVHQCPHEMRESIMKISFEQIMNYDPDVIIINHPTFQARFSADSRWKVLRAVREGRVYFVPHEPFSWLDRPASFMRFIGIQWLAVKLHPDLCPIDLPEETDRFLRLFFRLDLSGEQIKTILKQ